MPKDSRVGTRTNYTFEIDLNELGLPKRIKVQGELHEQDAINANLKTILEATTARPVVEGITVRFQYCANARNWGSTPAHSRRNSPSSDKKNDVIFLMDTPRTSTAC